MLRVRLTIIFSFAAALAFCAVAAGDAGDLDPSFDGDGKAITDFGHSEFAEGLAIQQDGKIVVVGLDTETDPPRYYRDFVLARYLPNGSLDSTFGGGRVRTDFGNGSDMGQSVAIQPDGKLVVAGRASSGFSLDLALARYNTDASLDSTFSGDGKVVVAVGEFSGANAVVLQQDGRIVVAGETSEGSGENTLLARFDQNGRSDTSFGAGGVVSANLADGNDFATSMALQADGKIVLAGIALPSRDLLVARFNTNGTLDPSFDGDGTLRIALPCCAVEPRVALQSDGKIVVAAGSQLLRYATDGSPDSAFGADGKVDAESVGFHAVALQAGGGIVVAGTTGAAPGGFYVDRFLPDGTNDFSFSSTLVELAGPYRAVADVGLQSDRKIVVAGSAGPDQGHLDFVVIRLLNPAPQPARCRVPAVRGKKLGAARRSILRARCTVGKITRKVSRKVRKGRVMSQRPRSGRVVAEDTKVRLVVSRGLHR